jgi:hypothetical protein
VTQSIFNYSSDEWAPFTGSATHEPYPIEGTSTTPIVITQPANDFAFRAGILNSLVNGRFVVCAEPKGVQKISDLYEGKIDFIQTEEVQLSSSSGKVYKEPNK